MFADNFFQSTNVGTFQPHSAFAMKGALPKLFSGLTSRVFDADTGILLKDPCYVSAFCIRQFCYLLYKMEMPYSPEQEDTAVKKMVECDKTLDGQTHLSPYDKVLLLASNLISEILGPFSWDAVVPRQGPGASSHRITFPWEKWHFIGDGSDELPDDLFTTPGLADAEFNCDRPDLEAWLGLSKHHVPQLRQSKVSLVPKTSKGPRIISAEAVRLMWAQLGIDSLIRERISEHSYCRNSIPFDDQTVNAELALASSVSGVNATIDLSEASDRVSLRLIRNLFPTSWYRAIEESRSGTTRLPSGDTIVLSKVAPMGNGYCFSVESLVFWAISAATIANTMEESYTSEDDLEWACQNVHVYGDDIVLPAQYAVKVMSSLELYGFRINRDKSFWTGPFRESCGTDAFAGANITPLKIKTPPRTAGTNRPSRKKWDADFVAGWYDQSKSWSVLLPAVSAWMKEQVYDHLGFIPTYPEGWEGCIGEPQCYESIKGTSVTRGQVGVQFFQKVQRGPHGRKGFTILKEYSPPPSDGKLVKVVRVKNASFRAPAEGFGFSTEHGYLRWLQSCYNRAEVIDPFEPFTFTLRYATLVSVAREWVS
jgi:hypothetical protein